MPRIRRGGYIFHRRLADHPPPHVHVYEGRRLILKWNIEEWKPMMGRASARVVRLIRELVEEGRL